MPSLYLVMQGRAPLCLRHLPPLCGGRGDRGGISPRRAGGEGIRAASSPAERRERRSGLFRGFLDGPVAGGWRPRGGPGWRGWEAPPQSLRDSSPSGGAIGSGCSGGGDCRLADFGSRIGALTFGGRCVGRWQPPSAPCLRRGRLRHLPPLSWGERKGGCVGLVSSLLTPPRPCAEHDPRLVRASART